MTIDPQTCPCFTALDTSRARDGAEVECALCLAWVRAPAPPVIVLAPPVVARVVVRYVEPPEAPPASRVFRAEPSAPPDTAPRRGRTVLSAENREEARVRTLLYALRPDCIDPLRPPPPPVTAVPSVRIRDPMSGWGGTPAALAAPPGGFCDERAAKASDVLARLREMPEDARAVCRWLRDHAVYLTLRGLFVDVGSAFADAAQAECWARDLTARRDGAHHLGRTLVLAAATEWGIPGVT